MEKNAGKGKNMKLLVGLVAFRNRRVKGESDESFAPISVTELLLCYRGRKHSLVFSVQPHIYPSHMLIGQSRTTINLCYRGKSPSDQEMPSKGDRHPQTHPLHAFYMIQSRPGGVRHD